ncbi:MAG: cytochrome c3 family protein [Eggerthellaceae bacterium]|nr:cytochrome c3 family protein [Eggerthellaceae bacterium]
MTDEKTPAAGTPAENAPAAGEGAPAQRRRKKWPVVVGVVAVVCVLAGAGFMVWHEQPSFCNAICHEPMDPYVEGYYSDDATLVAAAHQREDVTCLQCHVPTIGEQVTEGIAWATGDFYVPLERHDLATNEFCLVDGCHTRDEIVAATEDWGGNDFNPHAAHTTKEQECGDCHSVHRESVMSCAECHSTPLPDGWVKTLA